MPKDLENVPIVTCFELNNPLFIEHQPIAYFIAFVKQRNLQRHSCSYDSFLELAAIHFIV